MRSPRIRITAPTMILAGILVIALGLRAWGISFGLPYRYHFDEPFYVSAALNLGKGVLSKAPYNPTGLSNFLFPQYVAYYILGKIAGDFSSLSDFDAAYRSDPTVFYLLMRLNTALLGAASTLVLFQLGKVVDNWKSGLVAAGLLAVSYLHVRDSHYAVPDIAMAFFVTLAVALAATGLRQGRRRDILLAGLAGGIAVAMKWTALFVVVPVLWAAFSLEQKAHGNILRKMFNPTTILAGISLVVGFSLASPQLLINPTPYIDHVLGVQQVAQPDPAASTFSAQSARWSFYSKTLQYAVGVVPLALGGIGMLRRFFLIVKARDGMSLLLVSFPLIYIPVVGFNGFYFARYLLPIIPFIALFAADIIVILWAWLRPSQNRLRLSLAVLLAAAAIAKPLADSVKHGMILTRTDTRTLAKQWIESDIPDGSKIAVDWPVHGPPLSTPDESVPYSTRVYNVISIGGKGLADHPLSWYEEQEFDYLITSSYISYNLAFDWNDPEKRAFYALLDEQHKLVKEFLYYPGNTEPPIPFLDEIYGPTSTLWQRVRPGPTIRIYRLETQET